MRLVIDTFPDNARKAFPRGWDAIPLFDLKLFPDTTSLQSGICVLGFRYIFRIWVTFLQPNF